jgi:hypothetical protein
MSLLTAFGISAPAGLNAYLPLLIVGLIARFTDLIKLNEPYSILTNEWVLGALTVLVLVEALVDKVPGLDHVNDAISTFIRPAAGAILFAASSNVISDINPALAAVCGLLAAGTVHAIKASARPAVTVLTAGTGNPVVSFFEDFSAVAIVLAAILAPALILVFLLALATLVFFIIRYRQRRRRQTALAV